MTITLTLPPNLEDKILAAAQHRHLPVQEYLLALVESAHPMPTIIPAPNAGKSHEHFMAAMARLSETATPGLFPDETWPRETIYAEHD